MMSLEHLLFIQISNCVCFCVCIVRKNNIFNNICVVAVAFSCCVLPVPLLSVDDNGINKKTMSRLSYHHRPELEILSAFSHFHFVDSIPSNRRFETEKRKKQKIAQRNPQT